MKGPVQRRSEGFAEDTVAKDLDEGMMTREALVKIIAMAYAEGLMRGGKDLLKDIQARRKGPVPEDN